MTEAEIPLTGGQSTAGVVRVGDTVRRPCGPRSSYVHRVLELLEEAAVPGAPRFRGIDERGREILTFLAGTRADALPVDDGLLGWLGSWSARFHGTFAGSELCRGQETVCHHDLAPWNLIANEEGPVGFIDFDAAAPGARVDDIGYLLWCFLRLGSPGRSAAEQRRAIRVFCDAYAEAGGGAQHDDVADAVLRAQAAVLRMRRDQAERGRTPELRDFARTRVAEIDAQIAWVRAHLGADPRTRS